MQWWVVAMMVSAAIPLAVAWRANRGWTIRQALVWGWLAWLAWLSFAWHPCVDTAYATVTVTGAAFVAVLGSRRPGVNAWNFIVASLLVVLWLGWAEGLLDGSGLKLGSVRLIFLSGLLATAYLNYIPTQSVVAAMFIVAACLLNLDGLWRGDRPWNGFAAIGFGLGIWHGWLFPCLMQLRKDSNRFDHLWCAYRDRYGAIWGERLRQQFNNAARHNQWPAHLKWTGLKIEAKDNTSSQIPEQQLAEMQAALLALMKRFRYDD
jgi:hypothetical protein